MNNSKAGPIESEAMKEVRRWKDAANEQVAGLPVDQAVEKLMDIADRESRDTIAELRRRISAKQLSKS